MKDSTKTPRSATYMYIDLPFEIDSKYGKKRNFTTQEMIVRFPLWIFHFYIASSQEYLHFEYIYFSVDETFQRFWFLS